MSITPNIFFDFEQQKALFETVVTKTKTQLNAADLNEALIQVVSAGFFDTGLLPVGEGGGLLALRGGFGHLQIVYQVEPGIHPVIWGRSEGDRSATNFQLAQPYRIWIADFFNGNISGARHFYSPTPIYSEDDVLYHVNLPNTNCRGYSGTGVGWMCLYHHDDTTKFSIKQLIEYAYQRASGGEAYNDANMSETDGPRFYEANKAPKYFCNAKAWEKKSASDGWQWTLDPKLLLPIMVKDMDHQDRHDGTHHLTIGDAMNGSYYSSYPHKNIDKYPIKPIAALKRGILFEKYADISKDFLFKAVKSKAKPINGTMHAGVDVNSTAAIAALSNLQAHVRPPVNMIPCQHCGEQFPEPEARTLVNSFPSDIEEFIIAAQENVLIVCDNCWQNEVVEVRVDMCYSEQPPADGGMNISNVWALRELTTSVPNVGNIPITNMDLIIECPTCNALYPRYIDNWGIDLWVYGYNTVTKTDSVAGCTNCMDHFFCAISHKNVFTDHAVAINLVNHYANPPQLYQAQVADWLVMNEDSPYTPCACGIVSATTNICHVDEVNNQKICNGCWAEDTFQPRFTQLLEAVNAMGVTDQANTPGWAIPVDEEEDYYEDDDHYNEDDDGF